ncbi:MAG: hypothetical protein LKG19_01365 [Saprospiraceae bacterium]|jgi:hypothetical protein|nr:hypothetical protein [Saprospiraceae bacterium]
MESEFDRNLQHKLLKHTSNMDVDAFWKRLEPKLPREQSRPKFIMFFIFFCGALCSVLFAWHLFLNQKIYHSYLSNIETKESIPTLLIQQPQRILNQNEDVLDVNNSLQTDSSNSSLTKNKLDQIQSGSHDLSSNVIAPNVNISNINKGIQQIKVESQNDEIKMEVLKKNVQIASYKQQKRGHGQLNSHLQKNIKSKIALSDSKNILLNTNPVINSHSKVPHKIQKSVGVIASQDDNKLTKNAGSFEGVNHGIQSRNEVENNVNLNSNKIPVSDSTNLQDQISYSNQQNYAPEINPNVEPTSLELLPVILHLFPIADPKLDVFVLPIINTELNSVIDRVLKDNFHVLIMPYIGLGGFVKHLKSSVTNDTLQNYVWVRNQAESNLEEWNFGFDLNLSYKKFGVLTGLNYLERNEKFEYHIQQDLNTFGLTSIRREIVQDTMEIIDTISGIGWYGSNGIRNIINYNKIRQWNIPIGIFYQTTINSINLHLGFGGLISLSNEIYGKSIDSHLNVAKWNQSTDLSYKMNLGVGWYGDMGCGYRLNRRMAISTSIRIQSFPKNYLSGPLSLRYLSIMGRTGLTISLNR